MNSFFLALLVTVPLFVGLPAHAQVYKCTVDGKVVYQDGPCASGAGRVVDTRPSSEGVTGLRADADRMAAKERAQRAENQRLAAEELAAKERKRERIQRRLEIVRGMQQPSQQPGRPPSYSCRPSYTGGMNCDPR